MRLYIWLVVLSVRVKRSVLQIPRCIPRISHDAPLCNRNVHMCAHFYYKMVHCGIWDSCIAAFVQHVQLMIKQSLYRWGNYEININSNIHPFDITMTLLERHGVLDHQQLGRLINGLTTKKATKLRITGYHQGLLLTVNEIKLETIEAPGGRFRVCLHTWSM